MSEVTVKLPKGINMQASSVKSNTDKANYSAKASEKQSMGTKGLNHFLTASLQISPFNASAPYVCLFPRNSAFQQLKIQALLWLQIT